jgi:hypothetical protein
MDGPAGAIRIIVDPCSGTDGGRVFVMCNVVDCISLLEAVTQSSLKLHYKRQKQHFSIIAKTALSHKNNERRRRRQ